MGVFSQWEVVDFWEWEVISLHWIEALGLRQAKRLITLLDVKDESLMQLRTEDPHGPP